MVKCILHFTPKITVETIDDAEGTPGASRQYIRFNSVVKPKLEKALNECTWSKNDQDRNSAAINVIRGLLLDNNFMIVSAEDAGDLNVLIRLETTEK